MMSQLLVLVTLLFAGQETVDGSRLRAGDARTAAMIRLGLEGSVTFRGMVAEIAAGDVIVHAGSDQSLPGRQTGRMRFIGRAGTRRYVRVSIRAHLPPSGFIAALAHELQHVSEIIAHPEVHDPVSLQHLYRRIGKEYRHSGRMVFETETAKRIAADVLRELNNNSKLSITRNVNTTVRQGALTQ